MFPSFTFSELPSLPTIKGPIDTITVIKYVHFHILSYLLTLILILTVSDMLANKKVSVAKAQSFPIAEFLAAITTAETGKAAVLKI